MESVRTIHIIFFIHLSALYIHKSYQKLRQYVAAEKKVNKTGLTCHKYDVLYLIAITYAKNIILFKILPIWLLNVFERPVNTFYCVQNRSLPTKPKVNINSGFHYHSKLVNGMISSVPNLNLENILVVQILITFTCIHIILKSNILVFQIIYTARDEMTSERCTILEIKITFYIVMHAKEKSILSQCCSFCMNILM